MYFKIKFFLNHIYLFIRGSKYDIGNVIPYYSGFEVITKKKLDRGLWFYQINSQEMWFSEGLITWYYENPDHVLPQTPEYGYNLEKGV